MTGLLREDDGECSALKLGNLWDVKAAMSYPVIAEGEISKGGAYREERGRKWCKIRENRVLRQDCDKTSTDFLVQLLRDWVAAAKTELVL